MYVSSENSLVEDSSYSKRLATIDEIKDYLRSSSKEFKHIENIEKLAEGGESVVYKLNY